MTIQNEKGSIEISNEVFTVISGHAATNCFGVKGMAFRNMKDGIVSLLGKHQRALRRLLRMDRSLKYTYCGARR